MKVLLTGANGFLGSAFKKYFGEDCLVVPDNWLQMTTKEWWNFYTPLGHYYDTYIIHCADKSKDNIFKNNETMIQVVSHISNLYRAPVIYFSSLLAHNYTKDKIEWDDIYPTYEYHHRKIDFSGMVPHLSAEYGMSKRYCCQYLDSFAYSPRIFVIGNILGINDRSNRIIPTMIKSALLTNTILIKTMGMEERTFMYVDDIVSYIGESIKSHSIRNFYRVQLLGGNELTNFSVLGMAEKIKNIIGTNTQIITGAEPVFSRVIVPTHIPKITPIDEALTKVIESYKV